MGLRHYFGPQCCVVLVHISLASRSGIYRGHKLFAFGDTWFHQAAPFYYSICQGVTGSWSGHSWWSWLKAPNTCKSSLTSLAIYPAAGHIHELATSKHVLFRVSFYGLSLFEPTKDSGVVPGDSLLTTEAQHKSSLAKLNFIIPQNDSLRWSTQEEVPQNTITANTHTLGAN